MVRSFLFLAVVCLVLIVPAMARGQKKEDKTLPGDEMIYKYLCAETDKLSLKFLDGARTLEEWQKNRPRLYQEYMDMLGLWPIPEKTPLNATITGTLEAHGVIVEKLHFQSKPGLYVTANLYRPKTFSGEPKANGKGNPKRLPAILYLCGHSNKGRDGNKTAFQDHGFWFANNGYVCLILDTLQLGEIPGVHHGTYGVPWNHLKAYGIKDKGVVENRWWWHSLGYSPAAVEAWNGVRAIDYLLTRPEIDPEKIGVTGISGGGAATFWVACADDRVKVAVPVSGMSDLESYVKNKVINGHCDCMFLYNTYQWDWTTIAALIAPRPMLFANSDDDKIFPMDGNRRIIEKLRKLYKMYDTPFSGKPKAPLPSSLIDEYVSKGGHAYRPDLRIAIFKFINKHLKGDTTTAVEDSEKYKPIAGEKLRVFPTDADIPKDAITAKIDETFVPRGKVILPEKGKFAEWKVGLLNKVREQSFRNLPERIPLAQFSRIPAFVNEIEKKVRKERGPEAEYDYWGDAYLKTDPTIEIEVRWQWVANVEKIRSAMLIVRQREDEGSPVPPWSENLRSDLGYSVTPRGINPLAWTLKSPPNYLHRSHLLLGRTVDQDCVKDLAAACRYFFEKNKNFKNHEWKLGGHGQGGILAAYAALFEPSIKEVVIIDPPKSHLEGPHFLNVLRVLDIPEALGLLAPNVKLTLINAKDPAFDRTEEIYRLAGATDKLVRK